MTSNPREGAPSQRSHERSSERTPKIPPLGAPNSHRTEHGAPRGRGLRNRVRTERGARTDPELRIEFRTERRKQERSPKGASDCIRPVRVRIGGKSQSFRTCLWHSIDKPYGCLFIGQKDPVSKAQTPITHHPVEAHFHTLFRVPKILQGQWYTMPWKARETVLSLSDV